MNQPPQSKNPNNENAEAVAFFNNNLRLKSLMLEALDYGIKSLEEGLDLRAFSMTEKEYGEPPSGGISESLEKIKAYIKNLKDEPFSVFIYPGTLDADSSKWKTQNAIFVNGFDRNEDKGILLVQMYNPKKSDQEFSLSGDSLVQYIPNIMKK